MTIISGALSTGNVNQDNIKRDVAKEIFMKKPQVSSFMTLMLGLDKIERGNPKHEWFNESDLNVVDQVNNGAGYASGATSIVVDDGTKFRAGDNVALIDFTTGAYKENIKVSSVATNTLTVIRSHGDQAAVAMVDNDYLQIIGNSYAENSGAPAAKNQQLVSYFNYTQIFKDSAEWTRTSVGTDRHAQNHNDDISKRLQRMRDNHMRDVERAIWWGQRDITNSSTMPERTTGGLYYWLRQANAGGFNNEIACASSTLTKARLDAYLRDQVFAYGGEEKVVFCSPFVTGAMSELLFDKVRLDNKETIFGLNIDKYESPYGTVRFVRNKNFTQGIFANAMFAVDLDHVSLYGVDDTRLSKVMENVQDPDVDGRKDQIITELGLCAKVPETLSMLYDITAVA